MGRTKHIREAAEAEPGFGPLVDAADITVRDMSGKMALNGNAPARGITVLDGVEAAARHSNLKLPGTVSHGSQRAALDRYALAPFGSGVAVGAGGSTVTLIGHVGWAEYDAMPGATWITSA